MQVRKRPIIYSFRRCPYAMRARMAIVTNYINVELREVLLRDKPDHMIALSAKGTVPILWLPDGKVIDESLDVMQWAYKSRKPDWQYEKVLHRDLIYCIDEKFKFHLDRYKYASRYPLENSTRHRDAGVDILVQVSKRLDKKWLCGDTPGFSDIAILPFIRQYRIADADWFDNYDRLDVIKHWLENFVNWEIFILSMKKYLPWKEGAEGITFGVNNNA